MNQKDNPFCTNNTRMIASIVSVICLLVGMLIGYLFGTEDKTNKQFIHQEKACPQLKVPEIHKDESIPKPDPSGYIFM